MDDNLTPAMKQYAEMKRRYPDCLLLFRMGDFYETFFEDAVTASRELEIVLTSRGKGEKKAPLAGIPFHSLEPYLAKLVRRGYKVAICEQMEDPKEAKGIVKRDIVRIVTPGTIIEDSMLEQKSNNYIMSLYANAEECHIALCDISTGELVATSCAADKLGDEIARFSPSECVLPVSLGVNAELVQQLSRMGIFTTKYDDRHFRVEKARNELLQHFNVSSLEGFGIGEESTINAAGALISYLRETQLKGLKQISRIRKLNKAAHMSLDAASIRNLEIVKNQRDGSSRNTLLGVLDKTITSMGSRMLRQWLKAPLMSMEEISKRLNAVSILHRDAMLRDEIQHLLKPIADIERIMGRVNCGAALPKDLLALKASLKQMPFLKKALTQTVSKLLENKRDNLIFDIYLLDEVLPAVELIESAIREDAASNLREGGVIKPEFNFMLSELHLAKTNGKEFIKNLEENERARTGIKSLKVGFNRIFGYFIEISRSNLHLVPPGFIRKQTTANGERFVTEELKKQEELILNADERICALEQEIYANILQQVAEKTGDMQDNANKIAVLDVLQSLAAAAIENNYAMPSVDESGMIELKASRHPVLERLERNFVPNDIKLGKDEMMIITGPNMAGKSTVMRQLALNVLLAQCGSFVAASEARIGLVDKIFTRIGAHDDLAMGQSTFMVEMLEVANILNNATPRSLVVLDEIGRGTSTFDGVAIAWAVAEHIYSRIKAKTIFATHYHVMNKLSEQLPRIKNYNIAVTEEEGNIVFLRKLIAGGTDRSYGVHVARLAGVPAEVLARADEIQKQLEAEDEMIRKLNAKLHVEQTRLGDIIKE